MNNKVFLDYDQAELDRQYNQRAWVPNADEYIRRYATMSDAVRARLGEPESIAYGIEDQASFPREFTGQLAYPFRK